MDIKSKKEIEDGFKELIDVIATLRDPIKGSSWDLKQNHNSLIPYLIEEANEVVYAIRQQDSNGLKEELGDLLLQILLHSQIANEANDFCITDVIKEITKKLIRRHPNIFKDPSKGKEDDSNNNWEKIKEIERPSTSRNPISERLRSKIRSQTSLNGALMISNKAFKIGLEWKNEEEIWNKLLEEIKETRKELMEDNLHNAQNELGDTLFTLINIARWHGLNIEDGLYNTNIKFLNRLAYIELNSKCKLKEKTNEEIKELWESAKRNTKIKDKIHISN